MALFGFWSALVVGALPAASLIGVVWIGAVTFAATGRWLPALRDNGFGICTGLASPHALADAKAPAFEGLTVWMHRTVQSVAGRLLGGAPLTFGDLWNAGAPAKRETEAEADTAPRAIELAMIASDISRNRTVQLPFIETPSPIYVDLAVLARYFPDPIVKWIEAHQGPYDERVERKPGVVRLPPPDRLPIVFAARLSLSFPVLLSAVPLLTPDFQRGAAGAGRLSLRQLWLSDGGLTSNFPVHFFDSPLPARPTFCLNLVGFDAEIAKTAEAEPPAVTEDVEVFAATPTRAAKPIEVARAESRTARARPKGRPARDPEPGDDVWGFVDMARDNRIQPAPFTSFGAKASIGSFLATLVDTARFWSDNQMLMAPGVRDRVVNIALRDDEGGLNLNMTPSMIEDLDYRGRAAGLLISARFDPAAPIDPETGLFNAEAFANHRWVRYRNFMAAFEDATRRFVAARRASDAAAQSRGEAVLSALIDNDDDPRIGYKAPAKARPFYLETTRALEAFAMKMAEATRADASFAFDRPQTDRSAHRRQTPGGAPRPKMRFTMRPWPTKTPAPNGRGCRNRTRPRSRSGAMATALTRAD